MKGSISVTGNGTKTFLTLFEELRLQLASINDITDHSRIAYNSTFFI